MDDFAQQFLDSPDTEESLAWLRGATPEHFRSLGEYDSTEESITLVEELYTAGAAKVWAVEVDRDDDGENTGKLLIELSVHAADREAVLTIVGKIAESQGFDAEPDTGKTHVFVMLD